MAYTYEQIGKRIRARMGNPASYAELTDEQIGKMAAEKNPKIQAVVTTEKAPEKSKEKTFGRKVGDFFTSNTQKFAETLGASAAEYTGEADEINESSVAEADARFNLAKQMRSASPEQDAKIKAQLGKGSQVGVATDQISALNKTNKQVFGEGLGTGLEMLSGGTLKGAKVGGAVVKGASTLGGAVKTGAKIGAIYGAVSGASQGLQEDKSWAGILGSTAIGGITGAAVGGALGAAGHGLKQIPAALSKKSEKIYKNVLKMTPSELQRETAQGKNTPGLLKRLGAKGSIPDIQEEIGGMLDDSTDELQKVLTERAKQGATISVDDFQHAAEKSLEGYKTHVAEYGSIKDKLDTIIANTRRLHGDNIPVDIANKIKSDLWKDSFNRAGTEVVNNAVYEAGSAMKTLIEAAVPDKDVAGMNKLIGELIVAAKQLDKSVTRAQTGRLSSWVSRGLGLALGNTVVPGYGGVGGFFAGPQIEKVLMNPTIRTSIAALMAKAGQSSYIPPQVANELKDIILRHLLMEAGEVSAKRVP